VEHTKNKSRTIFHKLCIGDQAIVDKVALRDAKLTMTSPVSTVVDVTVKGVVAPTQVFELPVSTMRLTAEIH
jgi:hypothetical protein